MPTTAEKRVWINVYKTQAGHEPSLVAEPVEFVLPDTGAAWGPGMRTWAASVNPAPDLDNMLICFEWCHASRELAIRAHVEKLCVIRELVSRELTKWLRETRQMDLLREDLKAFLEIEDVVHPPDDTEP